MKLTLKVIEYAKESGDFHVLSAVDLYVIALTYELSEEFSIVEGDVQDSEKNVKEVEEENTNEKDDTNEGEGVLNYSSDSSDFDGGGWITPSNIGRHKVGAPKLKDETPEVLNVACVTEDYAMQNVILKMKLGLVSLDKGKRIKKIKSHVLRCHACFKICFDMSKQFCPSCGGATLLRTTCSTSADGKFRYFLNKKKEWHNKGTIYSLPKPKAGKAGGKPEKPLILREDQKEYKSSLEENKRQLKRIEQTFESDLIFAERPQLNKIQIGRPRNYKGKRK